MNLLKSITLSIGWLSGSLAGLGAILYAFGYLVIRAQMRLLGIDGLFGQSPDQIIQEGARFFMVVGELVIQALLTITLVLGLAGLLVFALIYLPLRSRIARAWPSVVARTNRLATLHQGVPWQGDLSWYGLLLGLLFLHFLAYRNQFAVPLELSNVLYTPAGPSAVARSTGELIRDSLMAANPAPMYTYFVGLVFAELHVVVLLVVAWRVTAARSLRPWLIVPFAATVLLYTLYLPMAYGVLARPTRYNRVTIRSAGDVAPAKPGAFFLLSKTDQEFIVWDPEARKVLWIPKGAVTAAEVMQVEHLFKKRKGEP